MELVGREAELAVVDAAIANVVGGSSRVLVVAGEPGIGKTALLEAAAERAASGMLVVSARAAEHEREVPFALTVAALDDHVALAAVLPAAAPGGSPAERFRYHRALRSMVEQLAPVALVLDDLHWADNASLEFVLHLLRRPPRAPRAPSSRP